MCLRTFLFLLFCVSLNGHAYVIEHYARIINATSNPITVDYDVCKYTNHKFTQCEPHQDSIPSNSNSENYLEILVDSMHSFGSSSFSIYTYIVMKQITNNSISTRFRTNEDQKNDNPEIPLHGYCRAKLGALVIQEIGQRFHCLIF